MPSAQTTPSIVDIKAITRRSEKVWMPAWKDRSGNVIMNTAGHLPVKPMYDLCAVAVYEIKIFKTYSDTLFYNEINALNSSTWRSWTQYQAWISEIKTDGVKTIGDDEGEDVCYVVRCIDRVDGWRFQLPDASYVYKDGADIKTFLTTDEYPYIGNLDGSGAEGTDLLIEMFDTKKQIDFNSII